MRNVFTLRRRAKELEAKVQRLQKAESELALLRAKVPSARFTTEINSLQEMMRMPSNVDELETRLAALRKEMGGYQHSVFISYSVADLDAANAVCHVLESRGLRCWMAPRDIIPGQNWAEAVVEAIDEARVMVLVLSASANKSAQVLGEVERATSRDTPVIAIRLESVTLTRPLELFLSRRQWLDATSAPMDSCLEKLADAVERLAYPEGYSKPTQ